MDNRAQAELLGWLIGGALTLFIVFLLFDAFFCGCFIFDQGIISQINESVGSITLVVFGAFRWDRAD